MSVLKSAVVILIAFSFSASQARDLSFSKACERGTKVTISAVGDVLLHAVLQAQSYSDGMDFRGLWAEAIPYFKAADLSYANLEGPVADYVMCNGQRSSNKSTSFARRCDSPSAVYTGYPRFNYPSLVVRDLKRSGIDVVSTANNHSLDRYQNGVLASIESLEKNKMPFTGIKENAQSSRPWYTITRAKGKKIAWLSCTFSTNGIGDSEGQVLGCYSGNRVAQIVSSLKSIADAIIVTPHWGAENTRGPGKKERSYARAWLDSGAIAVLGAHPHVVQPWEKYVTKDGREAFIIYSLGNFVSSPYYDTNARSIILYLGLSFSRGRVWVNGVRYLPIYMYRSKATGYDLWVDRVFKTNKKDSLVPYLSSFFGRQRLLVPGQPIVTNMECSR